MKLTKNSRKIGTIKLNLINENAYTASIENVQTNDKYVSVENFGSSKFTLKEKKMRSIGTNWYLNQPTDLYWIHDKNDTDITTQGYVGIKPEGSSDRWFGEITQLIEDEFIQKEDLGNLVFEVLATGTKSDISVQEIQYRPQMNIGWNYSVGGNCVNGVLGRLQMWMPWYEQAIAENPSLTVI